jgi:hypothetical protein
MPEVVGLAPTLRVAVAVAAAVLLIRGGRLGDHGWRLAALLVGLVAAHAAAAQLGPPRLGRWNEELSLGAALLGAAVTLWGELVTPRLPLAVVGAAVGWTLLREVATVPPWTILAVGAVAGAWTWQVAPRVWSSAVGALGLMVAWAPPGGTASLPWTALVALAAAGLGWQWVSAPEPTPG